MLHKLKKIKFNTKKRKGRGYGSKKGGHTIGKGQKGQKSRSGYSLPRPGFEGGQMPLSRRIPKLRGFRRAYFKDHFETFTLSVDRIEKYIETKELKVADISKLKPEKVLKDLGLIKSHVLSDVKIVNSNKKDFKPSSKIKKLVELLLKTDVKASKSVQSMI